MQPAPRRNDFLTRPALLPGLFSPAECQQIRQLDFASVAKGRIYNADGSLKAVDESVRRATSRVVEPLPANLWIVQRIQQLFQLTNQSYYQFHLTHFSPLQVLEYQAQGFYDWHLDLGEGEISTRKLSAVVFLSDPADYTGGRLQIETPQRSFDQAQGTAVVFPSFMNHRVEPVTQGQRWTLVAWAHGNAFR